VLDSQDFTLTTFLKCEILRAMNVRLETELTAFKLTDTETGKSVLFQTDWDFPSLARSLGWDMTTLQRGKRSSPCDHSGTDGTVRCPECRITAGEFIAEASKWLHDHEDEDFAPLGIEEYFSN
jgi:hypothetical protein